MLYAAALHSLVGPLVMMMVTGSMMITLAVVKGMMMFTGSIAGMIMTTTHAEALWGNNIRIRGNNLA